MDGMPLYEYARKGIPLPRPIEPRPVTVHSLEMTEWLGTNHSFSWPSKDFSADEKKALAQAIKTNEEELADAPEATATEELPTAFVLKMRVSGGTYVRSIIHDLAHTLGSAGHVVTLTRSRQGQYALEPGEGDHGCVPWELFQKASAETAEVDEEGWKEWEREVMEHLEVVS